MVSGGPYLSCGLLTDEAGGLLVGIASQRQAKALDVGVCRGAIVATLVLDLADLNHLERGSCETTMFDGFGMGNSFGRQAICDLIGSVR